MTIGIPPRTAQLICVAVISAAALGLPSDRHTRADDAKPNCPPAPAKAAALNVGDKAPEISGWHPNGNPLNTDDLAGKTVLVAFWEFGPKGGLPLEPLREVRKKAGDKLLILTVCVNGMGNNWDAWSKVLVDQGKVNYGDGERRFIDDPKWWNLTEISSTKRQSATAYGVGATPAFFLLRPDGTLGGVHIRAEDLKAAVEKEVAR